MAPSIVLGHSVGRLGCFFAGCCYGKPCNMPWAVTFTHPESLAPQGISLHPTQLYASFNGLLIFAILMGLKHIKAFEGQLFWTYVLLYAVTRSIIEFFRGDHSHILTGGLFSTQQLVGMIMAAIATVMLIILRSRHARSQI